MPIISRLRLTTLAVALLLAALLFNLAVTRSASGQETPKVGVLFGGPKGSAAVTALVKAMEDLGYQDGKTVALQFRYAEGKQYSVATQPTSGSAARECRRIAPATNARRPRSRSPAGAASPRRSRAAISGAVGAPDTPARKMRTNSP